MTNKIEKYSIDKNGKPKVVMNQNAAREIRTAISAFRAGIAKSNFTENSQERLTGEYIADTFLQDKSSKDKATSFPGIFEFLYAVEEKIDELL